MNHTIEESVISAISRQKGIASNSVSPSSLLDDLGISSLDAISIAFDLEEEYDVQIENEELASLKIVSDIVSRISALI